MSGKPRKEPGPDHPITVEPFEGRVVVKAGEQVLADTTEALTLQESTYPAARYIPLKDVALEKLKRTDHSTYCPYKGDASYYSFLGGENAVWTYEDPYPAVASIAGYVAFYPNKVEITES